MKRSLLALFAASAVLACWELQGQPVYTADPPAQINDYISLGEWNTAGNTEGWGLNAAAIAPFVVANGELQVTTTSGDPWIYRVNFSGTLSVPANFTIVEARIKILQGERSGWEMFWGSTTKPGPVGGQSITYALGWDDNEYHIVHWDFTDVLAADGGTLDDFRIDCGQNAGNKFLVDYVRVGKVSPDTDGDGLPDTVETATGVFVSRRDTGTSPTKADTDGDGVSDFIEVQYNTDPNDPTKFPVPSIDQYSANPVVAIVGVAIVPNVPTTSNGTATGFQVSPTLPAGLSLDATTGVISGTPTTPAAAKDYTVTANFQGGKTATSVLTIEVRNPYFDFTVPRVAAKVNTSLSAFSPNIYGPRPTGFTIQPALPEGILMDPTTGEISGLPSAYSPLRDYTVVATYATGPNGTNTLQLAVIENPAVTVDPAKGLVEWFSLAEFAAPAELSAMFRNSLDWSVADGILSVTTTGGDPYFGRAFTPADPYAVAEIKMKITEGGSPFRFYWSENTAGRGVSEATSFTATEITGDATFHVYQIDFSRASIGILNYLRLDPGDNAGTILDVDYIRIGSLTALPKLSAALQATGKLRVSWNAALAMTLQSTTTLPTGWAADSTTVTTQGAEKFIEVTPSGTAKFYRLAQ